MVGSSQVLLPNLFLRCLGENKMQHYISIFISLYILSPAACSVDEQVLLKLAITEELGLVPVGPDPSKLTIL